MIDPTSGAPTPGLPRRLASLANQFDDPFAFVRELVQNAVDADAQRIDVRVEYHALALEDRHGIVEVAVVDDGAGMSEAVIDEYLTRLHASSKRDDATRIGTFGIGFASIFAFGFDAGLVRTGRAGRAFELVLHPDGHFDKAPVRAPVTGTEVRLWRRTAPAQAARIAERVHDALWAYCRYVTPELTFDDRIHDDEIEIAAPSIPEHARPHRTALRGDEHVVVGCVPIGRVVLCRGGIVLDEGPCAKVLPELYERLGAATDRLWIFADSPALETDASRKGTVATRARDRLADRVARVCDDVFDDLTRALGGLAPATSDRGALDLWHHAAAHLVAAARTDRLARRTPLLSTVAGTTVTLDDLRRVHGTCVLVAPEDVPRLAGRPGASRLVVGDLDTAVLLRGLLAAETFDVRVLGEDAYLPDDLGAPAQRTWQPQDGRPRALDDVVRMARRRFGVELEVHAARLGHGERAAGFAAAWDVCGLRVAVLGPVPRNVAAARPLPALVDPEHPAGRALVGLAETDAPLATACLLGLLLPSTALPDRVLARGAADDDDPKDR